MTKKRNLYVNRLLELLIALIDPVKGSKYVFQLILIKAILWKILNIRIIKISSNIWKEKENLKMEKPQCFIIRLVLQSQISVYNMSISMYLRSKMF